MNDLKLRGILEKDTSVRAQINELGEEVQKQLSTQQMEVESVQSQIRDLDQQIDMAKANDDHDDDADDVYNGIFND